MKRFGIKISCVFLLSMIIFSACKKKDKKIDGGGTDKPATETSYDIKDFVIQDEADGRILDFMDVHKIVQQNISEVANGNVVDTIYARVMVDLKSLKLKPRFYDIGRVSEVNPDSNEVRDLTKYEDKPYPTMKITFNTGVSRTFALVVSKAEENEDNKNLLKNQNIYYIKEYKITNGSGNEVAYSKLKITNTPPILQQKEPVKDTIEFEVVNTNVGVGNKIVFAPWKYGNEASDTVAPQKIEPATLEYDPTLPDDYKDYKTMSITFANGFVREYKVKVSIIDNNANLNKNVYDMTDFILKNKDGKDITTSVKIDTFTHTDPTTTTTQNDTIVLTIDKGNYDFYPLSFSPAKWKGSPDPDTINYTATPTNKTLLFAQNDTNIYKELICTFSNGFSRKYNVKLHQESKPLPTEVNFTAFKVEDNGASVQYAKLDTTGVSSNASSGFAFMNEGGVTIVRPLIGWAGGRTVTLQFTGLEPAVTGTLAGYSGENIGNTGASLDATGKMIINFGDIQSDSVKLTLKNTNLNGESKEYTIKLLSGMLKKPTLVMDGNNTKGNYAGTKDDREFKIAVDESYVYVLIMNTTSGGLGEITRSILINATYDLYAYAINSVDNTTKKPTASPIQMNLGGIKIIDIVCFDNVLYGIGIDLSGTDNHMYTIYKWTNTGSSPVQISKTSGANSNYLSLFTAQKVQDSIHFYSLASTTLGLNNPKAFRISTVVNGSSTSTIKYIANRENWTGIVSGQSFSTGYATMLDMLNIKTGLLIGASHGFLIGKDFAADASAVMPKAFNRYSIDGSNLNPVGANMEILRDKYYFINNGVYASMSSAGHRMNIMDLGLEQNLTNTLNNIGTATDLYKKEVYRGAMGVNFSNNNLSNRGNCRTYKLSNGKVRIASLVAMYGFKVWDME